jgi:co-chaperonin GroES (HSP10)
MSKIHMRKNLVAVSKLGKPSKKSSLDELVVTPETAEAQGVVRYKGPEVEDLLVGQKVFFGNKRHELRLNGEDVLVMEESNIYAIVEESGSENPQDPAAK